MREAEAGSVAGRSHYLFVFLVSLLLWLLLTGTLDPQELVTGTIVSLLVTVLFASRLTIFSGLRFGWMMPVYIFRYLVDFFIALISANLQLARHILTPSLPIHPEIVEIRTGLQSALGRMLLANTITLTPGTLTVDVNDDVLLVHWVYCPPGTSAEQMTAMIAGRFEKHLERFLL